MNPFEQAVSLTGWFATGSRVICDPAPTGTDEDFVLYSHDLPTLKQQLEALGYTTDAEAAEKYKTPVSKGAMTEFTAYRHTDNDHNLIVVKYPQCFQRWKVATMVAKELNIMEKKHRSMLFNSMLSGGLIFTPPDELVKKETDGPQPA